MPAAADVSFMNHVPAGALGRIITASDGHLHASGQRQRFFGVNITSRSNMPTHTVAEGVAQRLAQMGVNMVRVHLTDTSWGGGALSFINYGAGNSLALSAANMERFDYFFKQLKDRGIYLDLNLLTGREFSSADGLPAAIDSMGWKEKQIPAIFDASMIQLQKDYASLLLNHVNPYTGLAYKDDPALAVIEVLNEQGLMHAWLDGKLEAVPDPFAADLKQRWNVWLKAKYGTQAGLAAVWGMSTPMGAEMISNGDFSSGTDPWQLHQGNGAAGTLGVTSEGPIGDLSARIICSSPGTNDWDMQFVQNGLNAATDTVYSLSFSAKADSARSIYVFFEQSDSPWQVLGFSQTLNLTSAWQAYNFVFKFNKAEGNARLNFRPMGQTGARFWFSGISLKPGGTLGVNVGEDLDSNAVPLFSNAERSTRPTAALRDFTEFLWAQEEAYYAALRSHVKNIVGCPALMMGTQVMCSTPNLMAQFDIVDTHQYWLHPDTSLTPMRLENRDMVADANAGCLGLMALRRVAGKPFSVSEYGHPFPNAYGAEGFPMFAAYAALQDWDMIMPYTYSDGTLGYGTRMLNGPFEFDTDPTKICSLPWAARVFRQALVAPAQQALAASMSKSAEFASVPGASAWTLLDGRNAGFDARQGARYRTYLITEGGSAPLGAALPAAYPVAAGALVSDTSELAWNSTSQQWKCDTLQAKAFIGIGSGSSINLGGMLLRPRTGLRDWRAITVLSMDGGSITGTAQRLLVSAAGAVQNTGMTWMSYPTTPAAWPPPANGFLGFYWPTQGWGSAPVVCEGVESDLVLPFAASQVQAWALDANGARGLTQSAQDESGSAKLVLSANEQTVWYEVAIASIPSPSSTETPSSLPSPTSLMSFTSTETPSPSISSTPSFTDTPASSLTQTPIAQPSPSFTPTLLPTPEPVPGEAELLASLPLPNPGPKCLAVKLNARAAWVRVKVYSVGYSLVADAKFGPFNEGWQRLDMTENLQNLAAGVYYYSLEAGKGRIFGKFVVTSSRP
jgi:hypothetical protein